MRFVVALVLFIGAVSAACAQSPPMMTDDPDTPGDGRWEINVGWGVEHGSSTEHEAPLLDFNYGVGDRLQLKYEVPWVVVKGEGSGLGNSLVGVKWRFIDRGDAGWHVSTYPQVELRNPGSRSAERGLADDGTTVRLPLEFQRSLASFAVNFELGRALHSREEDEWFGGVVFARSLREGVAAFAELHGESLSGFNRSAITANIGARWELMAHGALMLSAGHDVHNGLDEKAATVGYAGWQITF
jgi:hypothetical protein